MAPGNQILGVDCISYLGSGGDIGIIDGVWENPTAIDWRAIDRCLQGAAQTKVKLSSGVEVLQPVALTIPPIYMSEGARYSRTGGMGAPGAQNNPFIRLHLPPWMQNDPYRFSFQTPSGRWYQSLTYNAAFKDKMVQLIKEAGARYNSNSQISVVRIAAGFAGESQPVTNCAGYWPGSPDCGTDNWSSVVTAHQQKVSCDAFIGFIRELNETAYKAFPDKPVVAIVGASPCVTSSGQLFSGQLLRRELFEGWYERGIFIGASINSLKTDRADADQHDNNVYADWMQMSTMSHLSALGFPTYYEWGETLAGDDRRCGSAAVLLDLSGRRCDRRKLHRLEPTLEPLPR